MIKPSNRVATRGTVLVYLVAAYDVSEQQAAEIINKEEHRKVLDEAENLSSFAYYPGDKIARLEGLVYREGYIEPDDEDEYN